MFLIKEYTTYKIIDATVLQPLHKNKKIGTQAYNTISNCIPALRYYSGTSQRYKSPHRGSRYNQAY